MNAEYFPQVTIKSSMGLLRDLHGRQMNALNTVSEYLSLAPLKLTFET